MTNTNDAAGQRAMTKLDEAPPPTMEMATRRTGGIVFTNFGQVIEFAREMATSSIGVRKHLRGNVGACIAIITQALEWELSPFAVASKSYSVNDQIAYEAQLINAVILRRAPIVGRFKIKFDGVGDDRVCTVALAMRDGGPDAVYESPKFGKIQPKNSPLWKNDPDQQQFYSSSRALCRRHFPDVLLGVYSVDELIDSAGLDMTPTTPAPRRQQPKQLADRIDALVDGVTIDGDTVDPETGEITEAKADAESKAPAADPVVTSGKDSAAGDGNSSAKPVFVEQDGIEGPKTLAYNATPAASQGPQDSAGVASSPRGGSAPSDLESAAQEARKARVAEIIRDGDARAQAGLAALRNFLEQLRADGEDGLVTAIRKTSWHETAKAVGSKGGVR